jgi:hypothetical protein
VAGVSRRRRAAEEKTGAGGDSPWKRKFGRLGGFGGHLVGLK